LRTNPIFRPVNRELSFVVCVQSVEPPSAAGSHKAHKRIFSDRDPFFYWLDAQYEAGSGGA
jgi:hypothetical protein